MFHLLVSSGGWADGGDTIDNSRIYIKSTDNIDSKFFSSDGKLDIAKVGRIPALLMTEIGGREPQIARVARITEISQGPRKTQLQYVIDTTIPAIPSDDLRDFASRIGVDKYTLSHTHWRICNADLFRILLEIQLKGAANSQTTQSTVFSIDGINEQEDDLVSVMMPFGAEFTPVYKALRKAATAIDLRCQRADDIWKHHQVIQDIVDLITKARVVVCDCSGKNPNVFYEIGIAHSLGKEVILITQAKSDVPFDLQHLRYVLYMSNKQGLVELTKAVQDRLKTLVG